MPTPEETRILDALAGRLRALAPALLAVSGGLDSRLLAFLVKTWGLDFELAFFQGPHVSVTETALATRWLERLALPHHILDIDVLAIPQVAGNTRERCYYCKSELFRRARELAGARTLTDGTNADDASFFRPGLQALAEQAVRSPYAELGVTKATVRALAAAVGLDNPDQPSRACLLTRFAYGLAPDEDILERLSLAEDQLIDLGLEHFRLRIPGPDTCVLQLDHRENDFLSQHQDEIQAILNHFEFVPFILLWSDNVSGFYDAPAR